ncbi:hypothetical protein SOVF_084780 isoform B, partial [Spinacia oleracea]
ARIKIHQNPQKTPQLCSQENRNLFTAALHCRFSLCTASPLRLFPAASQPPVKLAESHSKLYSQENPQNSLLLLTLRRRSLVPLSGRISTSRKTRLPHRCNQFHEFSLLIAERLNLDGANVNVNGGAIALGYPFGATCMQFCFLINTFVGALCEIKHRGRDCRFGVVSMFIATSKWFTRRR